MNNIPHQKNIIHGSNTNLTHRNWVIGLYIREYEQRGADRAQYGEKVLLNLSKRLYQKGLKSMGERRLREYRLFYQMYPQIWRTASAKFQSIDNQNITLLPLPKMLLKNVEKIGITPTSNLPENDPDTLVNRLTYSHFLELLSCDTALQRIFYETESLVNNWNVRDLQRAMNSLLFERTGLSKDIGNKHYRIYLVFYHRILKCHVLIDLKMGDFDHSDAGQMNLYLNYFRENEMTEGDNPPVGIILCAQKDAALVHYATGNLPQTIFVSKYLVNFPTEEELKQIVREEQERLEV